MVQKRARAPGDDRDAKSSQFDDVPMNKCSLTACSVICQPCLMTVRIYRIYLMISEIPIFHTFSSWLFKSPWTSPWLIVKSLWNPHGNPNFSWWNSHGKFSGNPNGSPRPSASLGPGVARYRAWIPDPRWGRNADDWGMVNMALFYPR